MTSIEQINALPFYANLHHDIIINGTKFKLLKWQRFGVTKIHIVSNNEKNIEYIVNRPIKEIDRMEVSIVRNGLLLEGKIFDSDIQLLTQNNQ